MSATQTFIEKAQKGGYKLPDAHEAYRGDMLFGLPWYIYSVYDPECWKAVGKVEGWEDEGDKCKSGCGCVPSGGSRHHEGLCSWSWEEAEWLTRMRSMIDALAEGKTIEEYLSTIV